MQIESSPAEHHPNGGIAASAPHATLTLSAEPEGASMLVDCLFEDFAPSDNDGKVVNVDAVEHWDYTDDVDVRDIDDPPVCDRGPNLCKRDL
jgi:hypothetical protein